MEKKYVYKCQECGSENIQVKMWVNPNTNEVVDDECAEELCWCEECEAHQGFNCIIQAED